MNFKIGNNILKEDKPGQYPEDEILNEDDRLVRSWFSVEVKDKQGDIVPIDELKRIMNVWMRRGSPISDQHTNRIVGKGLNWQIKEHPKTSKEAVMIDYQIYKDYSIDDTVWDEIKTRKRKGLSLGGRATKKAVMKDDDYTGQKGRFLKGLELYEIASVDEPANQFAYNTEINYLAKGSESFLNQLITDLRKDYSGFNNFEECYQAQVQRGHDENAAKRIATWMMGDETMKQNKKVQDTEEECEEGIIYDDGIEKKVKKIGGKYHVVHCHKSESEIGKPIESSPGFRTRERAMEQHRAVMANENKEEGRPDKEWFERTVETLRRDHKVDNPEALANWIWHEQKKGMIPGGLSEGKDVSSFDPESLAEGIKVEMEHTNDENVAREIATDHLTEDPEYYKKLRSIEVKGGDVSVKPVVKFNLMKSLLQPIKKDVNKSGLIKELKKVRHYIKPGEQTPKGVNVKQGERGGYYYEDKPQVSSPEQARPTVGRVVDTTGKEHPYKSPKGAEQLTQHLSDTRNIPPPMGPSKQGLSEKPTRPGEFPEPTRKIPFQEQKPESVEQRQARIVPQKTEESVEERQRRIVQPEQKQPMNTADYRKLAYEQQAKGQFKEALENYKLAIENYPKDQLIGQLGQRDFANLKQSAEELQNYIIQQEGNKT